MNFRLLRYVCGALALVVVCLYMRTARAEAQTGHTLRIAETANDAFAEGYYADDMGFFKRAGINVEVQTFTSGAAVQDAVIGGAADIGISNIPQLANAFNHGVPIALVASGPLYSTTAPTGAMCVAKASPLRSLSDLVGKTVAISGLRDIQYLVTTAWLSQHGVDPSQVKFVDFPFSTMGAAVARGTVDAAVMVEPTLSQSLAHGEVRIFAKVYDSIAPQYLLGAWFATTAFAQKNPDLVKRFQAAIYGTARWANRNHSLSAPILIKYSKIDPAVAQIMVRSSYAESMSAQLLQPVLDFAYKNHLLDKQVSAADMILR